MTKNYKVAGDVADYTRLTGPRRTTGRGLVGFGRPIEADGDQLPFACRCEVCAAHVNHELQESGSSLALCSLTCPASILLPRDLSAPRSARDFVRDMACASHHKAANEIARLLVSELVTNVVRHALDPLLVHVECHTGGGLVVKVDDGGPEGFTERSADADDFGGRGLELVETISDAWGVTAKPDGAGKTVWFQVGGDR